MEKKTIFTLIAVAIIAILTLVLTSGGDETRNGEEVTLLGSYICLPHVDTSGPQTMECAFGLETDEGDNYALDTSELAPGIFLDFETGDRLEVVGDLTSRDELDADDRLLQYDIEGVVLVSTVSLVGEEDEHVVAGGTLSFTRPSDFGLAISEEQILVESVIPPCADGFDYCLYYNGDEYEDTNFESAGVRIEERDDLQAQDACLDTPPAGYTNLTPESRAEAGYTVGVYSPIQDAATGHFSEGTIYRLAFDSNCFEFETRIGASQFENFEEGTIEEFTESDREVVEEKLNDILANIRFVDRENEVIFE